MAKTKVFFTSSEAKSFLKGGSAITIGNFDGLHLGHQKLIRTVLKWANAHGAKSAIMTFDPHPVQVLAPSVSPKQIFTREQKIECLSKMGADAIIMQKFDKNFAKVTPSDFFNKHLVKNLNAQFLCVGYDFTFGEKRLGTTEMLQQLAKEARVTTKIIKPQMKGSTLASSTLIRKLIKEGDVVLAKKLLTRPYFIDGNVVHGHKRGATFGIHTANLSTENTLTPLDGVYATTVFIQKKMYASVTNIGFNPTFGNTERSIETHILDFKETIYHKKLRLFFVERLRGEMKFETPTHLVTQIQKDIKRAQKILSKTKGLFT